MSRRFRHHIRGSEVGRDRPMAYMRRGRTRRSRAAHPLRRTAVVPLFALLLVMLLVVAVQRGLAG